MTQAAASFIQPLILQVLSRNPVHFDVMKELISIRLIISNLEKADDYRSPAIHTIASYSTAGVIMVTSIALACPKYSTNSSYRICTSSATD